MKSLTGTVWFAVVLLACPSVAAAQSPWPTVVIRTGALLADVGSDIRIDGTSGIDGTTFDLTDDLGFEKQATTFFVDGMWRISHRNRLIVDYEGVRRDATRNVLPRTITFRDQTFTAGVETQGFFDTFYLSIDYGYAFVANPRWEMGVTGGVTLMRLQTGLELSVQTTGDTTVSRDLADRTRFDVPVPLPGFFVNIKIARRWTISGATRLIKASLGDITASLAEAKGGIDFKISPNIGVGGSYYFNRTTVDRDNSSRDGHIVYSFNGPQAYVVFAF
jgi:hypothetical protein